MDVGFIAALASASGSTVGALTVDTGLITSLLSVGGSVVGTLGGILIANRLSTYRISRLEDVVTSQNGLVNKVHQLESDVGECQIECKGKFTGAKRDLLEHVLECHPGHAIRVEGSSHTSGL